ncbi:MAG: cadmium-translocating P-type ATPase [Planctomycetes bacterium]|nr:cadmium-translocating P-type ATPase [Planctomycetota bacterium]
MAHDHISKSVKDQSASATFFVFAMLLGGVLVFLSYIAPWIYPEENLRIVENGEESLRQFHADLMALAGALLLGAPLVWTALKNLWRGEMHMDELVAMAVLAAIAIGDYREAGLIALFMIVVELIESRSAIGARAAIASLMRLTPEKAHKLVDGGEEDVAAKTLRPGDRVRVRPGDNIPADGRIISGESTINQANITGESLPVDKAVGAEVFGGTINITGLLEIEVTKAGKDTTLGRVQELIMNAERTKIPLMKLIDQYASWYTPTILMVAGIVLFFSPADIGVRTAIKMLVVACPCALILATPTAMVAALSCAARLGILIKSVVSLEHARNLTAMVFDKTGTLTTGELSVTQMKPAPGIDGADLLKTAASLENASNHPIAKAVVAVARQAKLSLGEVTNFKETAGLGVAGKVNGEQLMVGRAKWLQEHGADMSLLDLPEFQESEGLSMLYVVRDKKCIGWIGLEDKTRPEARSALAELPGLGVRNLTMLTGDRWAVARRVAADLGCTSVHAEILPAEKLELVSELQRKGHKVAVVGDGVNDAPALAAGDLGVAMGAAGSDIAINSADIALMNNDLSRLPFLIKLSRKTMKVIWQNLVFGVLYIVVAETLVIIFKEELAVIAALFMHLISSAVVCFNSARLVRYGEEPAESLDEMLSPGRTPAMPQMTPAVPTT